MRHLPEIKRLGGSPPQHREVTQQDPVPFAMKESGREIATLEFDLEKTEKELRLGAEKERRLRSAIEEIITTGQEQRRRIDKARSRLVADQEGKLLHDMSALRKVSDEPQKQFEAAVALRESDTAEQVRVAELACAKAEKQLLETTSPVRQLTAQTKQHITELETLLERLRLEWSIQNLQEQEQRLRAELEQIRKRQSRFGVTEELKCFEELVLTRVQAEEKAAFLGELRRTSVFQPGVNLHSLITSVLRPIDLERASPDLT